MLRYDSDFPRKSVNDVVIRVCVELNISVSDRGANISIFLSLLQHEATLGLLVSATERIEGCAVCASLSNKVLVPSYFFSLLFIFCVDLHLLPSLQVSIVGGFTTAISVFYLFLHL